MKSLEQFQVSRFRFVGEQDGPPERKLKDRLAHLFEHEQGIFRAYLARAAYGNSEFNTVALCLRAQSCVDRDLVEKVGRVFASMFASIEHLDIVFVTEREEAELAKRCRPFFDITQQTFGVRSESTK